MRWQILVLFLTSSICWAQQQPTEIEASAAPSENPPSVNSTTEEPRQILNVTNPEQSQNGVSTVNRKVTDLSVGTVTTLPTTTPTTTTTATTPKPVPVPQPPSFPENYGNWSVKVNKSPCILFNGAVEIVLRRKNSSEIVVNLPSTQTSHNVDVSGNCGSEHQLLQLQWWSNTTEGFLNNTVQVTFSKQESEQYALTSIVYTSNLQNNKTLSTYEVSGSFFETTLKHSHRCKAMQDVDTDDATLYAFTQNLQFEAFRDENIEGPTLEFSSSEDCKADHRVSTGIILGIAVGIGLLIVMSIALGMYCVKRYRLRRGGYEQLDERS